MKSWEFITEKKHIDKTKMNPDQQDTTAGLHINSDSKGSTNRLYTLNRIMMAAACTDGETDVDMPEHSWAAGYNTAHPYTEEDQKILFKAYKAAGAYYNDVNKKDLRSQEPESTNKASPLKPFKGYKK
jgi:hypothetical protein